METKLINRSTFRKTILDYGGKMIMILWPGKERPLPNGKHMENCFERFREIIFNQDGSAIAIQNSKWKEPEGWCTEFVNNGPAETERIQVGGEYFSFFRNIPRTLSMPLNDSNIFFSKIEWVPSVVVLNHWSGESGKTFEIVVSDIKRTLRPKKELDEILAEIQAAASKPAKSEAERRLKLATGEIKPNDLLGISIEEK